MSERRIDPEDGQPYTFAELSAFYTGKYKQRAIQAYWDNTCKPLTAKAKSKARGTGRAGDKQANRKASVAKPKYRAKTGESQVFLQVAGDTLCSAKSVTFRHVFSRLNPGDIGNYYDLETASLGEGGFGTVVKGKDKSSGKICAVKSINVNSIKDRKAFEKEISIQQELNHPNIVKLYETFKDAKRVYLIMELCTGGELFDKIQEQEWFDEVDAARTLRQMLRAIHYLHHQNYVHRDIKPENFLLQSKEPDAQIKLIDFGLSKAFTPGGSCKMSTIVGTAYYIAPQVLSQRYDEKCDVWSVGVIGYILLSGLPPFTGTDRQILKKVENDPVKFCEEDWEGVCEEARDCIRQMLTKDDRLRPSAGEMLKHGWLQSLEKDEPPLEIKRTLSTKFASRFQAFRSSSKLKSVALTVVAQRLPDEDIEDLKRTFSMLDANQDGVLTPGVLRAGLEKHNVEIPENLDELIRCCDSDGSGHIDYTEFVAATLTGKQYARKEIVWNAFRVFDQDGDGIITKAELAELLKEDKDGELVTEMMKDADLDGDGQISFDEFCRLMEAEELTKQASVAFALERARSTQAQRPASGDVASEATGKCYYSQDVSSNEPAKPVGRKVW